MQPFVDRRNWLLPMALAVVLLLAPGIGAQEEGLPGASYRKVTFDQVDSDLSKYQDNMIEMEVYYGRPFTREECSLILVFGLLDINQFKEHDWFIFTEVVTPLSSLPNFIQLKDISAGMGAVPPDKKDEIARIKLKNGDRIRIRGQSIYKVKEIKNSQSSEEEENRSHGSPGVFQSKTICPLIDIDSIEKIEE